MPIINQKIRVLVVDDSMVARSMITQGLSTHPRIEIIGCAINTMDAKAKIAALKPDVVTMDVEMPGKSGPEFLREYIPQHPVPVILVSSLNLRVFDALDAGAVDFIQKPQNHGDRDAFITALAQKVLVAATAKVRMARPAAPTAVDAAGAKPFPPLGANPALNNVLIGLGASTGGTEATLEVMKRLPEDIPGMVIVQHMPPGFTKMYAERLNRLCKMEVREARNGDEIHRGLALVAPADLQARVVRIGNRYTLSCVPPVGGRHVPIYVGDRAVQNGGHYHDRHGAGRRRRTAGHAEKGCLHHWSGQGLQRSLRDAHGGSRHRCGLYAGLLRRHRRCSHPTFEGACVRTDNHMDKAAATRREKPRGSVFSFL